METFIKGWWQKTLFQWKIEVKVQHLFFINGSTVLKSTKICPKQEENNFSEQYVHIVQCTVYAVNIVTHIDVQGA